MWYDYSKFLRIVEEKILLDLWLGMDEIKAQVVYNQLELPLQYGQLSLDFGSTRQDED